MKAITLVGGKATRLLPLTYNTPKAIVPVLNIPFLEHVIRHLDRHQIKDIILTQGHLGQPIESYLDDGSQFGVKLSYIVEDTPLGTAGAVKNAERHLNGTFLVLNGDIFTDLDITAMIAFHRERRARVTIALTPVNDPTSYGLIETDAQGRVTRFLEKPSPSEVTTNTINAGIYVLDPDVLAQIPSKTEVSFEHEVFPQLLTQGESIYAYSSSAYWIDIGIPEDYLQLHRDLLSGKCRQYVLTPGEDVFIEKQSDIHPTAQIKGPAVIGAHCSIERRVKITGPVVIGSGCTILEDSVIEESIIWQNVRLGPRASLKNSIVADNCCFKASSGCVESVLGDNVTVTSGCKLEPGSRIEPGTIVKPKA